MTDQEQEHTLNADNQQDDENGQPDEAQTDVVTANDESAEESSGKVKRSMKRGKTIGVSYSASRDSDEYRRHMSNALQNGEVPKVIIEAYNLIPYGEDENADKVLGYVQGILDKLAMASTNKPCPPLRLFLSDTNDVNAFVLTEATPPVLVVSLGLWDMLIENGYGEDHLAAILGHERFHLRRHEKWQDMGNSRGEETVGDVYGIKEAGKAGYNPAALGSFFKLLRDQEKSRWDMRRSVVDMLDVHPSYGNRIRNAELALADLQLTKRMIDEWTSVPADIQAAADAVRFKSTFDRFKQEHDFEQADPVRKVSLIGKYFGQELSKKELRERDYNYRTVKGGQEREQVNYIKFSIEDRLMALRLFTAMEELRGLKNEPGVKQEAAKQLRSFMKRNEEGQRWRRHDNSVHYEWVLKQFIHIMNPITDEEQEDIKKYGGMWSDFDHSISMGRDNGEGGASQRLKEAIPPVFMRLQTDAEAFWAAQTREEAITFARRYEQAEQVLKPYENGISALKLYSGRSEWPRRPTIRKALETDGKLRLPWEEQVQWALDGQDGSDVIKRVALKLECDDPRLTGEPIPNWRVRSYSDGGDLEFEHLSFDNDGNIVDLTYTEEERMLVYQQRFDKPESAADLFASEYALQKQREITERKALETVDWSQMEKNFWGFVETHEEHLEPSHSVVNGDFPFAEELMHRLEALAARKPRKWGKIKLSFLTGWDFEDEKKRDEEYAAEKLRSDYATPRSVGIKPFSLPDLLMRAEHKYFGYASHFDNFDRSFHGDRGALPASHPMARKLARLQDTRSDERRYRRNSKTGRHTTYKTKPRAVPAAQERVEFRFGVDPTHPYIKAALNFDHDLLSENRRAALASNFRFFNADAAGMDAYYRISPRRVFKYAAVNSAQSVNKLARRVRNSFSSRDGIGWEWGSAVPMELLRALRRSEKKTPESRFDISAIDEYTVGNDFSFLHDKELAASLTKELSRLVNSQLRRNKRIDFKKSVPLSTLIKRFVKDHGSKRDSYFDRGSHNVFAHRPHLERDYQNHIKARIMALPLAEQAEHLARLMTIQIKDPSYREWAVDQWVEATVSSWQDHEVLGAIIDNGDAAYVEAASAVLKNAVRKFDSGQAVSCVIKLLDRVEAQKDLSYAAKEMLVDHYGRQFLEKDSGLRTIESAIDLCAHDPELRQAFLDYITEPMTKAGTGYFANLLKSKVNQGMSNAKFIAQFYDPEKNLKLSPLQENMAVDYLHQNFWTLPFELRTVYLDRILFPVNEDSNEGFDEAVQFVLDKVLPMERRFAPEAREALLVYLDACPAELRRTTFSAILATTEQAAKEGDLRPGQVLSFVLARTGAAGGQLLQAGHSYLSGLDLKDPEFIQFRDDLKSSKVDFAPPKRWEIFERIEAALPEDMQRAIEKEHIGAVLGSASTAYVVARQKADGETALKLMREDVLPIADLQFERYLEAFTVLATRHAHYKPLPHMVENAREMIKVSANGTVGKQQVDYAENEYSPLRIRVNDQWHDFNVAQTVSAGPEYLETARIHGAHLNDLDDGPVKQLNSIAIETAELYRTLRGKATDKDRHGGQQGIKGNTIGMFDVGQIPYDLEAQHIAQPQAAQKQSLGQVLGLVFNAAASGKPAAQTFVDAVTSREWGDHKAYLVDEQRALLARMDVHQGFGRDEKQRAAALATIFTTVWKTGLVDQHILKGISETISLRACAKMAWDACKGQTAEFEIKIEDTAVTEKPPRTDHLKTISAAFLGRAVTQVKDSAVIKAILKRKAPSTHEDASRKLDI